MYKCNESFTSVTGRYYSVGEEISVAHYGTLPDGEAKHFTYVGSSSASESSRDGDSFSPMVSMSTTSTESFDTTSSETTQSFDFGGGDSGGAGATGDF
jgi:uncharacterized membrane protein YgcG